MDKPEMEHLKGVFDFCDKFAFLATGALGLTAGLFKWRARKPKILTLFSKPDADSRHSEIDSRLTVLEKGQHNLSTTLRNQQEWQSHMHESNQILLTTLIKRQDEAADDIHTLRQDSEKRQTLLEQILNKLKETRR